MSIRRSKKSQNFTIIDNCVFNSNLSYRAIGILCYLLSKPENWKVSVSQLWQQSKSSNKADGRDMIYAVIDELIASGFIVREYKMAGAGKGCKGVEYVVYDTPQIEFEHDQLPEAQEVVGDNASSNFEQCIDSPVDQLPVDQFPALQFPEIPTLINTDPLINTDENKEQITPISPLKLDYWDQVCPKRGKKNLAVDLRILDWSSWPNLPSVPVMIQYLKVCRAKSPMTQLVVNNFGPELQQLVKVGVSVDTALTEAITAGWQSLKYNWIAKRLDLPVFGQQPAKSNKFDPFSYVMNGNTGNSNENGGVIDGEFRQVD